VRVTHEQLRIPDRGDSVPADTDIALLHRLAESAREQEGRMLGFPVNLDFDYRPLTEFLTLHLNNAGDPDHASEYEIDTKPFERSVVGFFVELAGAAPGDVFGHIAHGGTEANLYAAYVARERYADATLYASAGAHYSVPKIARILRLPFVPVATDADGALDLAAFRRELRGRAGRPAIVIATVGTTGRGAMDDIPGIRRAAEEAGVREVFIHSDAAFGGPLAEFGDPRRPWAYPDGADSVSVSGHKLIGSPLPSSVVLVPEAGMRAISQPDAAVGSDDNTISGSRDAVSPLLLWYALRRMGRDGLARRARRCLEVTGYATRKLAATGRHPTRAPGGNVVLFDLPPDEVLHRWHLLNHEERAHLVVMPHVSPEHIDRLCADLERNA
jgi:histidine decarboxylase